MNFEIELCEISSDYSEILSCLKLIREATINEVEVTINEVVVEENGSVDMNESLSSSILYKSKKQLTFDAKIPAQRSALKEICAGIIFTVDFDKVVE